MGNKLLMKKVELLKYELDGLKSELAGKKTAVSLKGIWKGKVKGKIFQEAEKSLFEAEI